MTEGIIIDAYTSDPAIRKYTFTSISKAFRTKPDAKSPIEVHAITLNGIAILVVVLELQVTEKFMVSQRFMVYLKAGFGCF